MGENHFVLIKGEFCNFIAVILYCELINHRMSVEEEWAPGQENTSLA